MWHFMGLWTTFVAGFSYMFLGFEIHDGGHSLASTIAITLIGYGIYVAYAMTGSYLGSRTGQTHALLTRSIFGRWGSWIVSAFILVAPLGWVAFQANLLAVPLGRLLQLGAPLHAHAATRRRDDPQQPARLHGHQRLRALPRHADPDPLVHLHGAARGDQPPQPARRHAAGSVSLPFWVAVAP